jgi:hypothetical protein
MLGDISKAEDIYVVCGYTDMRKSIDGLAAMIKQTFGMDPFAPSLFLFCDKRRDRLKALFWEGDVFVLLINALKVGVSNGPVLRNRQGIFQSKNSGGLWRVLKSTNARQYAKQNLVIFADEKSTSKHSFYYGFTGFSLSKMV